MILVVEAGGTKTNLALVKDRKIVNQFTESGLQLARESVEEYERKVQRWLEIVTEPVSAVWVFVAGANTSHNSAKFKSIVEEKLACSEVHIESDMLGACWATAGNRAGIVGILGTGSNACFYNGIKIEQNFSPGGFILGDEGGATYLGKLFLKDYLRNKVPENLISHYKKEMGFTSHEVIQQLYGGTVNDAAQFCAQHGKFIIEKIDNQYSRQICSTALGDFVDNIVSPYLPFSSDLYLVGSVGFYLNEILISIAEKRNINLIKNIQHPINDLSLFLANNEFQS